MNYISCYIKKEQPLKQYPEQYRTHMFDLHKLYITTLRVNKLVVTNRTVIDYVNNLQTTLLMYCLNFHMRKRNQLLKMMKATLYHSYCVGTKNILVFR